MSPTTQEEETMPRKLVASAAVAAALALSPAIHAADAKVEMTWMSIANWYFQANGKRIMMDAYITRLPGAPFFYGPAGKPNELYAWTRESAGVDTASITKVKDAVLGKDSLDWMLVGHSHWDHSWDSPTWVKMTGAKMIGGLSSCYQAQAQGVDAKDCRVVNGGEKLSLGEGITVRVVRWNHSGDVSNPIQHFPRELDRPPVPDAKGWLRAGVGEDYPNGGGNRAFLITVEGSDGPVNVFVNNSASAFDLDKDVVIDGVNYGAPIANLAAAMKDAGLTSVDAWIGAGGEPVAKIVVPVIHPKVMIPNHWDGLFNPFWPGLPYPYKDDALTAYLKAQNIPLMPQKQYFDTYVLTRAGVTMDNNHAMKARMGFADEQPFKKAMLDAVKKVASTAMGDDCGEGFSAPPPWATVFAQVK
jgi:L-ascorbate metabolism protein UlaG (beta-lactamase superfamily)